ncbi:MAG: hypothetical protein NEA02_10495 [Thermoanaerobaculia bacterium]|nr:hypothetical protein [Thermoanaerobaculia bacterium]
MWSIHPARNARSLGLPGASAGILAATLLWNAPQSARAQENSLKGDAALRHPAIQVALKAAEFMKAGRIDEAVALGTKASATEWKAMSAADRKDMGAGMASRSPDPKAFADAILKNGELSLMGNSAVVSFSIEGRRGAAYFEREAGAWRLTNGPMVFPAEPDRSKETRIENADILKHPIATLALQYLDLIHAGKIDDAKKLATTAVQAEWKKEPASEKAEILAYFTKNLPTRAAMTTGLQTGKNFRGVLIIDDDKLATLNLIVSEQSPTGPSTTTFSSTTMSIAFEKEGGQWKVRQ